MMNSNNNPDHASSQEFEPKEKKETVPQASFSDEKEDNETNRIIEQLPAPQRKMISTMLRASFSGPMPHPLFEKFNANHIDKFLDCIQMDRINLKKNF